MFEMPSKRAAEGLIMLRIAIRILFFGIALGVFSHENGCALSLLQGTVTFTTSHSVYIAMEYQPAVTENDSIPAGMDSQGLAPARVKAVSNSSLVLDRVPSLADAEKGSTVYVQADLAPRKISGAASPSGSSATGQTGKSKNPVKLDGYASFQYFRYRENDRKWEFDQPSFYSNARVGNISGRPLSLNLRFRTSLMRDLVMPAGSTKNNSTTNRLYDLSLEYGDREKGYFSIGRVRTIEAGSMGGIDGIVMQKALRPNIIGGVFVGVSSEMDAFVGNDRAVKKGAYLRWKHGKYNRLSMDMTASYYTEDASGMPTVHILALEQTFSKGSSFFLNQEAELNLRTRGESRESKLLQNVRSSVSWSPSRRIYLRGSYFGYLVPDYGSFYRTLDPLTALTYSLTHSFTPSLEVTLPAEIRFSGETLFGSNNDSKHISPLSYALRGNKYNFFGGYSGSFSLVETLNSASKAHHALISLSKAMKSGLSFTLEASGAHYFPQNSESYSNYQVRASASHSIGRSFLSTSLTHTWGEQNASDQFYIEWGLRLRK
jgi:hypothetical protein